MMAVFTHIFCESCGGMVREKAGRLVAVTDAEKDAEVKHLNAKVYMLNALIGDEAAADAELIALRERAEVLEKVAEAATKIVGTSRDWLSGRRRQVRGVVVQREALRELATALDALSKEVK